MTSSESWRAKAACRKTPVEDMYPHENASEHVADLLERCNRWCPVKDECLAFADSFENTYRGTFGIFGGLTPRERIARRLDLQAAEAARAACSTPGRKRSVERHYRLGQRLCDACAQWEERRQDEAKRWDLAEQLVRRGVNDHEITWRAGVHRDTVKRLRSQMQDAIV